MTRAVAVPAVTAPEAPAAWGRRVDAPAMAGYLQAVAAWRDGRGQELDELDRAAVSSPDPGLTGDVTLAMAMWQAVVTRYDELVEVWDGGRVGPGELVRLGAMVQGRGHVAGAGPAPTTGVSLPEACRLSDAVTAQLRRRLALGTVSRDVAADLSALRAGLERVRDLVGTVPPGPAAQDAVAHLDRLHERVEEVGAAARRGADVGGRVGPLGADLARTERDLIVAAAVRRDDARDLARAREWRAELAEGARAVTALAEECEARVRPGPVLAVPQVDALGPVPDSASGVRAYLVRLDAVARALDRAEAAYRAPVEELADLRGLVAATRVQAVAKGRLEYPEVTALAAAADGVLAASPVDLPRARALVAAYRGLVQAPPPALPASGAPSGAPSAAPSAARGSGTPGGPG